MTKTNKKVEKKVTNTEPEKTLEQVQMDGIIERLRKFMKDENITFLPKMLYKDNGIFPDLEIKILPDPVQNVYDEQTTKTA